MGAVFYRFSHPSLSGVPCVSSGELISGCDPPGRYQSSRIPGGLCEQLAACLQLVRGCHLWGRVCLSPSSSSCRQPASLPPGGDGPVSYWLALLWYSLSPLFHEWAQQCLRLELFAGKFPLSLSFFLFLSLSILQFGLLSQPLASSDCPQGIRAQFLP